MDWINYIPLINEECEGSVYEIYSAASVMDI
jgi:hypothetical protein